MPALPRTRLSVDEYLAWAEENPGRYELVDGTVHAMSPENAGHAATKAAVYVALAEAVNRSGGRCHVLPDGMTIRVDETTAYEPDAVAYCGEKLSPSAVVVPEPMIVVEVLSRSTRHIDLSAKLADYFRVPSVRHYLIVDPARPLVIHHARDSDRIIATRIVSEGAIRLEPPGVTLAMADLYPPD